MNYRHRYHAGNVADVFKHYVLCEILTALHAKPTPFCAIDSHAGTGRYCLKPPGEFERGIERALAAQSKLPALAAYFAAVAATCASNSECPRCYPGSPLLIRHFLRPQDRAVLLELHPEDHAALKAVIGAMPQIAVHRTDAWQGLKAFVPPPENRGLVLIDPPYERRDEFAQIAAAIGHALRHWRNGIYMVWYPIKSERAVAPLRRVLGAVCAERGVVAHAVELLTLPLDVENRLNGSGVVLINAPWQLPTSLASTLPALARVLADPASGRPAARVFTLPAH